MLSHKVDSGLIVRSHCLSALTNANFCAMSPRMHWNWPRRLQAAMMTSSEPGDKRYLSCDQRWKRWQIHLNYLIKNLASFHKNEIIMISPCLASKHVIHTSYFLFDLELMHRATTHKHCHIIKSGMRRAHWFWRSLTCVSQFSVYVFGFSRSSKSSNIFL